MKKILLLIVGFAFIFTTLQAQFKVPQQKEQGYVQDYENLLTPVQKNDLDAQIYSINNKSSIEISVVILNDLQDYDIAEAALAIGRKWGVGKKDMNNGIVYLVSPKNHKARIEVGYGLEGDLPDITAQNIGDNVTHFYKEGNWYGGIKEAITKIGQQLDPAFKEQQKLNEEREKKERGVLWNKFAEVILFSALLALLLIGFFNIKRKIQRNKEAAQKKIDDTQLAAKLFQQRVETEKKEKADKILAIQSNRIGISNYDEKIKKLIDNSPYNFGKISKEKLDAIDKEAIPSLDIPENYTVVTNKLNSLKTLYNSMIQSLTYDIPDADLFKERIATNAKIYDKKITTLLAIAAGYAATYGFHKFIYNDIDPEKVYNKLNEFVKDLDETLATKFPDSPQYKERVKIEAENKRHEEEEEARRKEEEEDERKRKEEEDDDSSSFGSSSFGSSFGSSSSGSESSSFGGFGGGSFGGGGASSSW